MEGTKAKYKVRFLGDTTFLEAIRNKIYDVFTDEKHNDYIIDWAGDRYYGIDDKDKFEVISRQKYDELMKLPEYRPHTCPVCGKGVFSMRESHETCDVCGWWDSSDIRWTHGVTAEEYKKLYLRGKVEAGWEYLWERDKHESEASHLCPICWKHKFTRWDSEETCPVCGWIDDWKQDKYEDKQGLNRMNRREYRKAYKQGSVQTNGKK